MIQSNLIDQTLKGFVDSGEEVGIALRDGTSVKGRLTDFDSYVLMVGEGATTVVYRHSVLKVLPAAVLVQKPAVERPAQPRPEQRPEQRRTEQRRTDSRPSGPRQAPKKSQPRRQPPRVEEMPAQVSKDDFSNPMAGQLEKWLKNQQGGK